MNYKYSILTYNFNNYEILHEVENVQRDVEYIYVTDNPNLKSKTWKVVYFDKDLSPFEKCYYVRFHPFEFVSTDLVIRLDGSYKIMSGFDRMIDEFGDNDLGIMIHPFRYNIVEEYNTWCLIRNYSRALENKCINFMLDLNFDVFNNKGMLLESFIILRNNALTYKIDLQIYSILYSLDKPIERIDQTISSFVLLHYYPNTKLLFISSASVHNNVNALFCEHNSNTPRIFECTYTKTGYWQNKLVDLI